jgi:hypothetical protein
MFNSVSIIDIQNTQKYRINFANALSFLSWAFLSFLVIITVKKLLHFLLLCIYGHLYKVENLCILFTFMRSWCKYFLTTHICIYMYIYILVELRFELRASHLHKRHSTAWAVPSVHFGLVVGDRGLVNYLPGLGLTNSIAPDLCLPSSKPCPPPTCVF